MLIAVLLLFNRILIGFTHRGSGNIVPIIFKYHNLGVQTTHRYTHLVHVTEGKVWNYVTVTHKTESIMYTSQNSIPVKIVQLSEMSDLLPGFNFTWEKGTVYTIPILLFWYFLVLCMHWCLEKMLHIQKCPTKAAVN